MKTERDGLVEGLNGEEKRKGGIFGREGSDLELAKQFPDWVREWDGSAAATDQSCVLLKRSLAITRLVGLARYSGTYIGKKKKKNCVRR